MQPTQSEVWNYFSKRNNKEATCNLCFKSIKHSGNTSNLIKHSKQHGKTIGNKQSEQEPLDDMLGTSATHSIEKELIQGTLQSTFSKIISSQEGGAKHAKLVQSLLFFICKDMRPFQIVEGEGFLQLMKEVAPNFKVPCANYLKGQLAKKYEATVLVMKTSFVQVDNFCLTVDIWTETMNEKSFMGITAHFLMNQKLNTCYLAVRELSKNHTATYISQNIREVLKKWNICETKIRVIVTDNASSMVSAIKNSFGDKKHIPCFAHTFNLVVELKIKEEVSHIIMKVREIVKFFENSVIQSDKLRELQSRNNSNAEMGLKLILDVKTRWNSAYYMLERFLKLRKIVLEILLDTANAPLMPTSSEIELLNQICNLLRPFEYVTHELSGQKYVIISKIIPMINCLRDELEKFKSESAIVNDFQRILLKELDKRFGLIEHNAHAAFATILDPRFKNLHFRDPIACGKTIQKLRQLISESETNNTSESEEESNAEQSYDFWNHHKRLAHGQKKKRTGIQGDEFS